MVGSGLRFSPTQARPSPAQAPGFQARPDPKNTISGIAAAHCVIGPTQINNLISNSATALLTPPRSTACLRQRARQVVASRRQAGYKPREPVGCVHGLSGSECNALVRSLFDNRLSHARFLPLVSSSVFELLPPITASVELRDTASEHPSLN
jgi:hypothetical protein